LPANALKEWSVSYEATLMEGTVWQDQARPGAVIPVDMTTSTSLRKNVAILEVLLYYNFLEVLLFYNFVRFKNRGTIFPILLQPDLADWKSAGDDIWIRDLSLDTHLP
jgi:hypothetical protein